MQAILSKLPVDVSDMDQSLPVSLEELAKLKGDTVTEAEIEAHLILPFVECSQQHSE